MHSSTILLALSLAVTGVHSRPRGPNPSVCHEDNQLRALERFPKYADEFCPEFLANTGRHPRWLDHWRKQAVSSACSCYVKTATSHGTLSTETATGTSFLASSTAPAAISEVFATTTPTGGYFPSGSAFGSTGSAPYPTGSAASGGYYPSGSAATGVYYPSGSGAFYPSGYSVKPSGTAPAITGTAPIIASAASSSTAAVPNTVVSSSAAAAPASTSAAQAAETTSSKPETRPVSNYPPQPFGPGPGKRGLCYDSKTQNGWSDLFLGSSAVTYGSNWGVDRSTQLNSKFSYVPTIQVDANLNNDEWNSTVPILIEGGTKGLFASNEPDNTGQANLTPTQAATVYKKYLQPYAGTVQLGTPAVTNGGGATGLGWLESFVKECDTCAYNFINVHYYLQRSDVDVSQFISAIKKYIETDIPALQAKYVQLQGLKIFIGEWWLWNASLEEGGQLMDDLLPWLDGKSEVLGYQAFGGLWKGNFINEAGNGLTPAGQKYSGLTV